jgi:exodeoxyribonuclease VII large subunit
MTPRVLPVGAFVFLFRELLEADPLYADLWLEGEVRDYSRSSAGHIYFTLSDDDGALKCVLFRRDALRQQQWPQLGANLAVHGALSIYPRSGSVQLQVDVVRPAGLGAAWLEVERLRQRLESEGLFDPLRKRPLPPRPHTIGVVTSPHGAAWQDIQEVVRRRYPAVRLVLSPAQVQGTRDVESIASAIDALQFEERVELIILARGGGATDDLSPFNDERVVRAVFGSRLPVVVGIGHATDRTLVEEAADLVAPTPSTAAELSVPSAVDLYDRLDRQTARLVHSLHGFAAGALDAQQRMESRLRARAPRSTIAAQRTRVWQQRRELRAAVDDLQSARTGQIIALANFLAALSPRSVLDRGFALLERADDGRPIFAASTVAPGARIAAVLADGTLLARVEARSPGPTPEVTNTR